MERRQIVLHGTAHIKNNNAKKFFSDALKFIDAYQYKEALPNFLKADSTEPGNAIILSAIANEMAILKNEGESSKYHKRAIAADSSISLPYINYGFGLNEGDYYEEAINILRLGLKNARASKLDSQAFYFNLSESYLGLHNNALALDLLDSAKAVDTVDVISAKINERIKEISVRENKFK
jgi:predicted Zn-dependent protease